MAQTYYTPFVVASGQVPSTQTDFPVLLKPTDNRFKTTGNGGHVAGANGYDLRPYSDAALASALTFEIVPGTYSASTGTFEMWVLVPSLSDGYTVYLGYGDSSLSSDASSTSTWNSNFKAVYHLGDGTTLSMSDSTANALTLTNNGTTPAGTGKIDGGASLNGSSQYLSHASASAYLPTTGMTLSAWINPSSWSADYTAVASKQDSGSPYASYDFRRQPGTNKMEISITISGGEVKAASTSDVSTSTWQHVAGVYDGSNVIIYYNGASQASTGASGNIDTSTAAFQIGENPSFSGRKFTGVLDEIRLSATGRSANWITTEYNGQSAPSTFAPTGTEVAVSASGDAQEWMNRNFQRFRQQQQWTSYSN